MIRKWIKDISKKSNAFAIREITTTEDWNQLLAGSRHQPALLFKHSNRCSLSDLALKRVLNLNTEIEAHCSMYIIDVVKKKSLSQLIADELGVRHESPQALLIYRGYLQDHASHNSIDARWIRSALEAFNP